MQQNQDRKWCCKCGKELLFKEQNAMIFKNSSGFDNGKYPRRDYYCCSKCYALWEKLRNDSLRKVQDQMSVNSLEGWLYLFFEQFLDSNPSVRTSYVLKLK